MTQTEDSNNAIKPVDLEKEISIWIDPSVSNAERLAANFRKAWQKIPKDAKTVLLYHWRGQDLIESNQGTPFIAIVSNPEMPGDHACMTSTDASEILYAADVACEVPDALLPTFFAVPLAGAFTMITKLLLEPDMDESEQIGLHSFVLGTIWEFDIQSFADFMDEYLRRRIEKN